MKPSHLLIYTLVLAVSIACNSKKPPSSATAVEPVTMANTPEPDTLPKASTHKNDTLPANNGPFRAYSFVYNHSEYTVPTDSLVSFGTDWFDGPVYGLASGGKELLATAFDKIGSPGVLAANCVEVVKGDQCGLYNLQTDSLLPPNFDLLLPSLSDSSKAYVLAQLGTAWYQMDVSNFSFETLPHFSLAEYLRKHRFGTESFEPENQITTLELKKGQYHEKLIVTPHYLSTLDLFPAICLYNEYTTSPQIKTIASASLGDRIISMLVAIYDESFNIRDMEYERIDVVVYDREDQVTHQTLAEEVEMGWYKDYRYLNDSVIELKRDSWKPTYSQYERNSSYEYFLLNDRGGIESVQSERMFNFTEFTRIDSTYFKGYFEFSMTTEEREKYEGKTIEDVGSYSGYCHSDHLSMEDLDIMRNEIFASYGYRFKTKKWKDYFEAKNWYQPLHDNVDDLLNERDRYNIRIILAAQKHLEKNGNPERHPVIYPFAG